MLPKVRYSSGVPASLLDCAAKVRGVSVEQLFRNQVLQGAPPVSHARRIFRIGMGFLFSPSS
jgi:hypothetical protein